eukprot:CAMPEP_0170545310 /NCGR_PEP_ID=MMETSP0211-20121228/3739_1 /TAXON_ID=311385 /ORGANISM="Pseudokeronopsis sp., Strain OXSARD2" /LENGTH=263 /DNA_ID=CAMNT_0010849169 /DNA_START=175 /DNA_END=966 /DNA_ORIENTATION=+
MEEVTVFLQLLLEVLEEVDLLLLLQVEPIHVSELQHLSAPNDLIDRLLEEVQLLNRVLLDPLEELDLGLDDRLQGLCVFLGLLMVDIPLKEEHVSGEFMLGVISFLLFLGHVPIVSLFELFVLVALVVTARAGAMFLPVPKAEPAELIGAHLAGHMVAALVLLYGLLALRAALGIGQNPGDVFALVAVLEDPLLGLLAVDGLVGLVPALEAEPVPALAKHVRHPHILILHTVVTPRERTPPHVLVIVRVGLAGPFHVRLQVLM